MPMGSNYQSTPGQIHWSLRGRISSSRSSTAYFMRAAWHALMFFASGGWRTNGFSSSTHHKSKTINTMTQQTDGNDPAFATPDLYNKNGNTYWGSAGLRKIIL